MEFRAMNSIIFRKDNMAGSPYSTLAVFKNFGYVLAFMAGIDLHSYIILAIFMFVDLIVGVLRVTIVSGPRSLKSYKFIAGITSKLLVLCVPLLVVWAGRGADINLLFLAQGALGMLVLGEAYSVIGNINCIRLGKNVEEFDVISSIFDYLQKILEALLSATH